MDIVFLGDSITEWWNMAPYSQYNILNYGKAGHTTRDLMAGLLLARIPIKNPKHICVLIGTNNADYSDKPSDVLVDIQAIVNILNILSPNSQILLFALLPRSENPDDPYRTFVTNVNVLLANTTFHPNVKYIDIGAGFLLDSGKINQGLMWDFLHLTDAGYAILNNVVCSHIS
jgi:lysophospholipase L1-like esterase